VIENELLRKTSGSRRKAQAGRDKLHDLYSSRNIILLLIVGRYQVQIPARRPVIITKVFLDFAQSLQANTGILP
jgi:hypothetical protein